MEKDNEPARRGQKRKKEANANVRKKSKAEIDCDKLIQLVQEHSCIWDKSSSSYKDNSKKTRAWNTISRQMNVCGN